MLEAIVAVYVRRIEKHGQEKVDAALDTLLVGLLHGTVKLRWSGNDQFGTITPLEFQCAAERAMYALDSF